MLRPDADANAEIDRNLSRWRSRFGFGGKVAAAERRHVSLLGVGRMDRLPPGHVDRLCGRAGRFCASPVEVRFDRIARFGRNSVVLFDSCGSLATLALRHMLADAMHGDLPALPAPPRVFVPHMTVLHDDDAPRGAHPIDPIAWTAREFLLVESVQGESRHRECGRWHLRGSNSPEAGGGLTRS